MKNHPLSFSKYAPERNFYTNENQNSGYDLRFAGTVDHSFCNSPDAGEYLSAALYNGGYLTYSADSVNISTITDKLYHPDEILYFIFHVNDIKLSM